MAEQIAPNILDYPEAGVDTAEEREAELRDCDPVFTDFGRRNAWGMVVGTIAARAGAIRFKSLA